MSSPSILCFITGEAEYILRKQQESMECRSLGDHKFALTGKCPHCESASVFIPVTSIHREQGQRSRADYEYYMWAVLACQGCGKYILGSVLESADSNHSISYLEHFPLGKPDANVAEEIPCNIREDFMEALRCRSVNSFNATVEMCRRAVQASCIDLKAPSDERLVQQIDWLAQNGSITKPLQDMAHRIRLGGNLGAHPPEDPKDATAIVIGPEYADAVIEFTRDFFQHVYVLPVRLKTFTFRKVQPDNPA